ncbi:hypothetical protein Cni_G02804 [Canna indica]|uniref:K Homology domain-containing protein n=1 Tax=Canna indica TaxID=4628 RepID=A0AAQ3Q308_9LILI|nr:hypothetical protein Cni_G02804 [Canna indica]
MAAKVDSTTSSHAQSTGSMSTSSTISASSPKISMFGAKSGFVIPKNKLSGSLVPIFRGGGKLDSGDPAKEETTKQAQRKTKWGPDHTLDAAVRKGRALAYQTRLEQITQQLKSGSSDIKDNENPLSAKHGMDDDSASQHIDKESLKLQLLELERREIIGEILRLNPSYKPPSDYRPVLKETDVPIPINAHPGYNFIGLLLGPGSNTQKRLEEETGAKIRVYGTKKGTREKHEITHLDKVEAKDAYEELHVNISAETYEKVDAAVALLELLFTPVSTSSALGSTSSTSLVASNVDNANINLKETPSSYMILTPDLNQGIAQPMLATAPTPLQYQPYAASWPPVAPSYVQPYPSSGFMPSFSNNSVRFPAPPIGPFGAWPYGGRPPTSVSSGAQLHQTMQQPLSQAPEPINHGQQPPAYPTMPATMPSFAASQPTPSGMMPPSTHPVSLNQPVPAPSDMSMRSQPLTTLPRAVNSGWSNAPQAVLLVQRSAFPPPSNPQLRSVPPISSPAIASVSYAPSSIVSGPLNTLPSQPNMPTGEANRPLVTNFAPVGFPSRPTATHFTPVMQTGPVSTPAMVPFSSGAPSPTMPSSNPVASHMLSQAPKPAPILPGSPAAVPQQPAALQNASLHGGQPQLPLPLQAPAQSPRPAQPLGSLPQLASVSIPGGMPGFSPATLPPNTIITPSLAAPKPPRPIAGDFTFQPLGTQVPLSSMPSRPNIHSAPFAAPQPPSFRPALQNSASSLNPQGFPGSMVMNQINPSQPVIRPPPSPVAPFSLDPTMVRPPPNLPAFSDTNSIRLMGPPSQMVPSFSSAPHLPNIPSMPGQPFIQTSPNQLHPANRPINSMVPVQQLGGKPPGYVTGVISSNVGGGQIYDPFSPTSVTSTPRKAEDNRMNVRKSETDSEYEDFMASVGVK